MRQQCLNSIKRKAWKIKEELGILNLIKLAKMWQHISYCRRTEKQKSLHWRSWKEKNFCEVGFENFHWWSKAVATWISSRAFRMTQEQNVRVCNGKQIFYQDQKKARMSHNHRSVPRLCFLSHKGIVQFQFN